MKPILNLALCLALSSTPALAASTPRWAALPQNQDTLLFSGSVRDELAPEYQRIFSLPGNMLEEELARIRLSVLSSGEHEKAIHETYAIWVRLARTPHRDGSGPLARGMAMRAWVLAEAGQLDQARIALNTPLPGMDVFQEFYSVRSYSSSELDPDSTFQRELAETISAKAEVVEMRERLDGEGVEENTFVADCRGRMTEESYRYLEQNFGLPTDQIARAALSALSSDDRGQLKKLGAQGTAVLAFVALADPEAEGFAAGVSRRTSQNSVDHLMALDRVAALRLFTECFDAGGTIWRSRILEVCLRHQELGNLASWVPFPPPMAEKERTGGRPWTPEWSSILSLLLSDEETREDSVALAHPYADWDAFTPELQAALGACLRSDDQTLAVKVLAALNDKNLRVRSAFPVYVAGLESSIPDIRRSCAWKLAAFHAVEELLPFAQDRDPQIRLAVAEALRAGDVKVRYGNRGGYTKHERTELTAKYIPVLESLLTDEEESVREGTASLLWGLVPDRVSLPDVVESSQPRIRRQAIAALADLSPLTPAERELLRRLLRDPDPLVRSVLADNWKFDDSSVWTEILSVLTGDTSLQVLKVLDRDLSGLTNPAAVKRREAELAAIRLRLENRTAPFEPEGGGELGWLSFIDLNEVTFSEAPFLLALALEHGHDKLVARQLDGLIEVPENQQTQQGIVLQWAGQTNVYNLLRRVDGNPVAFQVRKLEPAVRRALYAWGDAKHPIGDREARRLRQDLVELMMRGDDEAALFAIEAGDFDHSWVRRILSTPPTYEKAVELRWGIFRDEAAPLALRLAAGAGTDVLARAEGESILEALLAKTAAEGKLYELGKVLRGSPRGNEYLLEVMNENRLAAEPLRDLVEASFDTNTQGPGTDRVALAILDRYLEAPGETNSAVQGALSALERGMLVYEHPDYFLTAARDPRYVDDALSAMASRHLPEFVEPLRGMFENDWPALTTENVEEVRMGAAYALSEYGGRKVMDFLSGIVFEVEGGVRESVVEALENLRRYEELRASWRTSPLPPREEALIELVEMLGSKKPTIRAAAARGIAAFGAIEAIPKLIGLLEDDSELVRAAAEKALDQLFENPPEIERGEEESDSKSEEK